MSEMTAANDKGAFRGFSYAGAPLEQDKFLFSSVCVCWINRWMAYFSSLLCSIHRNVYPICTGCDFPYPSQTTVTWSVTAPIAYQKNQ